MLPNFQTQITVYPFVICLRHGVPCDFVYKTWIPRGHISLEKNNNDMRTQHVIFTTLVKFGMVAIQALFAGPDFGIGLILAQSKTKR
jgi:hypothetical protein